MKNLISISGKIGSGKDLVGSIIRYLVQQQKMGEKHTWENWINWTYQDDLQYEEDFQIKKFADKLKDMVCLLIGCTREQLEDAEFKKSFLGSEWNISGNMYVIKYHQDDRLNQFTATKKDEVQLSVRKMLQLLGTEALREVIHPNVHVNALFADYTPIVHWMCDRCDDENLLNLLEVESRFKAQGYLDNEFVCPNCKGLESEGDITQVLTDNPSRWIITDLRFPNELKAVKDKGGITIRVNRDALGIGSNGELIGQTPIFMNPHPSETALDDAEFDYTIDNNSDIQSLIEKVREILVAEKII